MKPINNFNKNRIGAIIQARMGSSRLPGKIMKTVLGRHLLDYQIERISQSKLLNDIIVATTTKQRDNRTAVSKKHD